MTQRERVRWDTSGLVRRIQRAEADRAAMARWIRTALEHLHDWGESDRNLIDRGEAFVAEFGPEE